MVYYKNIWTFSPPGRFGFLTEPDLLSFRRVLHVDEKNELKAKYKIHQFEY